MKTLTIWIPMVLLGAGLLFAGGGSETTAGETSAIEVTLEYLEGQVYVDGEAAEIGRRLPPGSLVETGPGGFAEVVFGNGNIFRLEENSEISIDLSSGNESISLQTGAFSAVFAGLRELGFGSERSIRLRTPTAVGGVRGTSFYFKIESPTQTYVCVCNGPLALGEDGEETSAPEHRAFRFTEAADGVVRHDAPLIHHDSNSMDVVARRIGVEIPWGRLP